MHLCAGREHYSKCTPTSGLTPTYPSSFQMPIHMASQSALEKSTVVSGNSIGALPPQRSPDSRNLAELVCQHRETRETNVHMTRVSLPTGPIGQWMPSSRLVSCPASQPAVRPSSLSSPPQILPPMPMPMPSPSPSPSRHLVPCLHTLPQHPRGTY